MNIYCKINKCAIYYPESLYNQSPLITNMFSKVSNVICTSCIDILTHLENVSNFLRVENMTIFLCTKWSSFLLSFTFRVYISLRPLSSLVWSPWGIVLSVGPLLKACLWVNIWDLSSQPVYHRKISLCAFDSLVVLLVSLLAFPFYCCSSFELEEICFFSMIPITKLSFSWFIIYFLFIGFPLCKI